MNLEKFRITQIAPDGDPPTDPPADPPPAPPQDPPGGGTEPPPKN